MAEPVPQKPVRGYSFTDHSALDPDVPHKGDRLDQELDRISASIQDTIDFIRQVVTDDGYVIATSVDVDLLTQVARDWASAPEGVEVNTLGTGGVLVPTGEYSAKHYALEAATYDAAYRAYRDAAAASAAAADTAKASATSSKNAAATSATNAATSEGNAADSASAAAGSASSATSSKNAAATSATNATSSKNAAATSATNAANSSTAAANAAISAATDASAAAASAATAQIAEDGAVAAQTGVSEAQTAAEAARDTALSVVGAYEYARAMAAGANNIVVNPQALISQENGTGFVPSGAFPADQWQLVGGAPAIAQQFSSPGIPNLSRALRIRMNAAASFGSSHIALRQLIETNRIAALGFGSSTAIPSGLAFWTYSDVAGAYSVSIRNAQTDRTFLAAFTVEQSGKWEFKTVTVPPDTSARWVEGASNACGAILTFNAACPTGREGPAGWSDGDYLGMAGRAPFETATDAAFYVTNVLWAPGADLVTVDSSYTAMRSEHADLLDCQRYFWKGLASDGQGSGYRYAPASGSVLMAGPSTTFHVPMRVSPAISALGTNYINCTHASYFQSIDGFTQRLAATAEGIYRAWGGTYTADARL